MRRLPGRPVEAGPAVAQLAADPPGVDVDDQLDRVAGPPGTVDDRIGGELGDQQGDHVARQIGLLSDEKVEPGDWVLIHVGFALSKIDEEEAKAALDFLEGIGQAYADELAALADSKIE